MIIDAYIQARMAASRLPGKMMLKLGDKTILEHVIDRTKRFKNIRNIVLLTTPEEEDLQLCAIGMKAGIDVLVGDPPIQRYALACAKYSPDWFLRVCADSPFMHIDMTNVLIDMAGFIHEKYIAYSCNDKNPIDDGLTPEIINSKMFSKWYLTNNEHVTFGLYDQNDFLFYLRPKRDSYTIDTQEDYERLKELYENGGITW